MEQEKKYVELGKKDAELFIRNERIDYEPFVAMSDLYLVRKTFPIDYSSLKQTLDKTDSILWVEIDASAAKLAQEHGQEGFNFDGYAEGFVEGVAAVWDKIKDKV